MREWTKNDTSRFFQGTIIKARTLIHGGDRTRLPRGHIAIECAGFIKHCAKEKKRANAPHGLEDYKKETTEIKHVKSKMYESF